MVSEKDIQALWCVCAGDALVAAGAEGIPAWQRGEYLRIRAAFDDRARQSTLVGAIAEAICPSLLVWEELAISVVTIPDEKAMWEAMAAARGLGYAFEPPPGIVGPETDPACDLAPELRYCD